MSILLYSLSFSSIAESKQTEQTDEPEKLSFYGGRVIPHISASDQQVEAPSLEQKASNQRRAIHPNNTIGKATIIAETQSVLTPTVSETIDSSDPTNHNSIVSNSLKITIPTAPLSPNDTNAKSSKQLESITSDTEIKLSREALLLAKKAQYYIERNWNKNTGLIDSVQGYHHTTMWDIASGIGAILALENLSLITRFEATSKLTKTFKTMIKMPLYNNELPNREYNTQSGLPSGSLSKTTSNGNGWSALDLGRLLIWLEITKQYKPELTPLINLITDKWQLNRAVYKQNLYGELKTKRTTSYRQEGRLGYLQYAAQGYQFLELDVAAAFETNNTKTILQSDIPLHIDQRNLPFFTSDSYVLQAIELGGTTSWWYQLDSVYKLHQKYYQETKNLQIFAEDSMNRKPWFSYNNINIYGQPWLSTNTRGKPISNPQVFSNKVAFAFSVLFDDEFSQQLATQVVSNSLSQRAIPTGLYKDKTTNTAYNINTNSLILVTLWFKSRGNTPIYQSP